LLPPSSRRSGPFLAVEQADWERTVGTARAAFRTAQAEAARLVAEGRPGRVVFLVPTASLRVVQGASLSATAGAFLTTIAQVGAAELGPTGVTVNVVAYGWPEDAPAALAEGVPVGRLARPDDIAAAVAFLASAEAAYVNGAVLAVDGGFWITKTGGGSPLLA
jgi:3-oxoacyl-[acyl-carrier protein] reductase